MSNTVRLLAEGHGAEQLLGHSVGAYLVPSLMWTAGIILVFAPLTVYRLRRS
jgi:hypothetical protein